MNMEMSKLTLAEQLKQEFMERYGLEENQVRLAINIYTNDLAKGKEILADFDKYDEGFNPDKYFTDENPMDFVYGEFVENINVFRKSSWDGEWAVNPNGNEDDEND